MEVLRLTAEDCEILSLRFAEYGNSHRRMAAALAAAAAILTDPATATVDVAGDAIDSEAAGDTDQPAEPDQPDDGQPLGESPSLARLHALRRLERQLSIDLGALCHRFQRREDPALHPLERSILESIACWRHGEESARGAGDELWVYLDRIQQLRQIIGEENPGWLEPVQG